MKRLVLNPVGWPCTLAECPPGLFLSFFGNEQGDVCLKTDYPKPGTRLSDAYCDNGDAFWGGAQTKADREALRVQPIEATWEEIDD